MRVAHQLIHIHPEAPPKPALGAPCNGCGVCCLAEPCPVGMLVSRKRRGACHALVWSAGEGRYHCGLMLSGQAGVGRGARWWSGLWRAWVRRLIAAGSGCDAALEVASGGVGVKSDTN
ncbi:MAG: hypothetical protein IIA02_12295 [Proteobacteria bacterium]|uniref:hypothetical protein n=1 Tax=Aquabacterium sp. TaxID=1872578 RepID=UPI0035C6A235|nr:hypothetical protein [Pseudomonadota bacterium]